MIKWLSQLLQTKVNTQVILEIAVKFQKSYLLIRLCLKYLNGDRGGILSGEQCQLLTKGEYNWRFFERVDTLCDGYDNSIRCHDTAVNSILNELLEHTRIATLHAQALREAQDRTENLLESMEA